MTSRRAFLERTALLCLATTSMGILKAGSSRASTGGAVWGVYSVTDSATDAAAVALGTPFAGQRINASIEQAPPGRSLVRAFDAGRRWSYRNMDCWKTSPTGQRVAVSWADVASGMYDVGLLQGASTLLANSRWTNSAPFHFSFHHEQAVDTPNQPAAGRGTPTDYQAAFRHVRSLYESVGATLNRGGNVAFCFVPTAGMFQPSAKVGHRVSEYDPGPDFYDLLGCDLYEHYAAQYRRSASSWLDPVNAYAIDVGRPFMLGEVGIAELDDRSAKASYVADIGVALARYGPSGPGSCSAILWTNAATTVGDYRITSSAEATTSFATLAASPLFSGMP